MTILPYFKYIFAILQDSFPLISSLFLTVDKNLCPRHRLKSKIRKIWNQLWHKHFIIIINNFKRAFIYFIERFENPDLVRTAAEFQIIDRY